MSEQRVAQVRHPARPGQALNGGAAPPEVVYGRNEPPLHHFYTELATLLAEVPGELATVLAEAPALPEGATPA